MILEKIKMTEATTIKLFSYPVIAWVFQYTGISKEQALILGILLSVDVLTAVIRQFVIDPRTFSSRKGIIGVLSKLLTLLIPFVIAIVGKGAGLEMNGLVKTAMTILIVYEGWSILGNIGQIRNKDLSSNEYDAISFLISKTQDFFKNILSNVYPESIKEKNSAKIEKENKETQDMLDGN